MFVGYHLPELGSDLIAALSGLDVDDFAHSAAGGCDEGAKEGSNLGN